jgi:hypothetical protein
MATRTRDIAKRRMRDTLRFTAMAEMKMMGMGNATRRRSVITSHVPIVISCA